VDCATKRYMMNKKSAVEIWGGIECTINRVKDDYLDQLAYAGHYNRGTDDIDLVASLGIKMLRYPLLWERHQPTEGTVIDWTFTEKVLNHLQKQGITPIAGLVHHGSGPEYVNFFDGSFEKGLAAYARMVANRFPGLEYYTPVNEPLTTARFCGLYGHWYPHGQSDYTFYKILVSECKATVMAMDAIREINPLAKLIQTEDLGKCYSTPLLAYQRDFENHRRWLSYDLLCGRVDKDHHMWPWMIKAGITPEEVLYFKEHNCVPHIAGFNYYITSERFLDEDLSKYPGHYHGGNGLHRYADIETVKVHLGEPNGPELLLKEAWEHLHLPMAITECHLHSTREDQMRWFHTMWKVVNKVQEEGIDIRAITSWAIFGLYGWNSLVTKPCGDYEPGVFNLSSGCPKPTALARLLQELTTHQVYYHPVLENEGWWQRETRQRYGTPTKVVNIKRKKSQKSCRPLLVLGKTGTLGAAMSRICQERNIHHLLLSRNDLDITNKESIKEVIAELHPWGVINATGYVNVDDAERDAAACMNTNCYGPVMLAEICRDQNVQVLNFSTDLVFNGSKESPYTEGDEVNPLNLYGHSKAMAERLILKNNEQALIIRTSSFFGPWDLHNFVTTTLSKLRSDQPVDAAADVIMTPTYVPDLVNASLDLLLDREQGIFHVTNGEVLSWADLARRVAQMAGYNADLVNSLSQRQMKWRAKRPHYSALQSEKGITLPTLTNALERFFEAQDNLYRSDKIAV
jgi:dTDP-4-dehydrorhamnose reductase